MPFPPGGDRRLEGRQPQERQDALQDLQAASKEVFALDHEEPLSVCEVRKALQLLGVEPAPQVRVRYIYGVPLPFSRGHLLLCGILEAPRLLASPHLHLVVRVSSIYGISQKGYEPRRRNNPGHPLGDLRVEKVGGGGFSGDGSLPVNTLAFREAPPVPSHPLGELVVEEVELLGRSSPNQGMLR